MRRVGGRVTRVGIGVGEPHTHLLVGHEAHESLDLLCPKRRRHRLERTRHRRRRGDSPPPRERRRRSRCRLRALTPPVAPLVAAAVLLGARRARRRCRALPRETLPGSLLHPPPPSPPPSHPTPACCRVYYRRTHRLPPSPPTNPHPPTPNPLLRIRCVRSVRSSPSPEVENACFQSLPTCRTPTFAICPRFHSTEQQQISVVDRESGV